MVSGEDFPFQLWFQQWFTVIHSAASPPRRTLGKTLRASPGQLLPRSPLCFLRHSMAKGVTVRIKHFHISICLSYLSIYLSICPSVRLSVYLSIHPSIHPYIHLSLHILQMSDNMRNNEKPAYLLQGVGQDWVRLVRLCELWSPNAKEITARIKDYIQNRLQHITQLRFFCIARPAAECRIQSLAHPAFR